MIRVGLHPLAMPNGACRGNPWYEAGALLQGTRTRSTPSVRPLLQGLLERNRATQLTQGMRVVRQQDPMRPSAVDVGRQA